MMRNQRRFSTTNNISSGEVRVCDADETDDTHVQILLAFKNTCLLPRVPCHYEFSLQIDNENVLSSGLRRLRQLHLERNLNPSLNHPRLRYHMQFEQCFARKVEPVGQRFFRRFKNNTRHRRGQTQKLARVE